MKFNKTFLTIGTTVVASSPVIAVVACAPSSSMGSAEAKFLAFVRSAKGKHVLEEKWTEKTLDKIATYKTPSTYNLLSTKGIDNTTTLEKWRKKLTKEYLVDGSSKNPNFLIDIANKVRGIDEQYTQIFNNAGFNRQYINTKYEESTGNIIKAGNSAKFDPIYKILNGVESTNEKFIKLGFASKINKLIIVKAYMSINKKQWQDVFDEKNNKNMGDDKLHNQTLTEIEKKIWDKENFVLNKLALQEKLGFKWSMTLTKEEDIQHFIKKGKIKSIEAVAELTPTTTTDTTIASLAKYSDSHGKTFHHEMNVFKNYTNYKTFEDMIGYKGLTSLPSGKKQLDFSFDSMTSIDRVTGGDMDYGFIQDGKIVQDGIEYSKHNPTDALKAPVSLTAVIAVLPRPDSTHQNALKLNATGASVEFNLQKLSTTFALRSNSLYMDAMKYFSNMKDGVKITVHDDYIKDILKDMGLGYIE